MVHESDFNLFEQQSKLDVNQVSNKIIRKCEIFTNEEEEMKRVFIQWMRVKRRSMILIILMARTVRATITIPTERVTI